MQKKWSWRDLPKYFTILAPMEGVTDVVFRQVINRAGRPDVFFTEFTNVSSFASEKGRDNALERLDVVETDSPIIAQIWGKNMGCPDRHVNKAGGGAAMIRTPELALECIRSAKANTNLPVSVKTRLGFTYVDEFREWLPKILAEDVANLTIHLRTRKEMSKVPAHYELIPEILAIRDKVAPQTLITINGDIADMADVAKLSEVCPGVDGFMIGRGVFFNPYCFTNRKPVGLGGEIEIPEIMELFRLHLDVFDARCRELEACGSRYPFEPLKRMFKVYVNSFDGASDLRVKLMDCKNTTEIRAVLDDFCAKL